MQNNFAQDILRYSSEQIRDEMLNFMDAKYGKTFVGLSLERRGIDRNSDKLICYADGEDRDRDFAYVYRDITEGVAEYSDTYFGVLIRNEVESEIENICRSFGFEAKVYSETLVRIYANEYDKSKTLSELKLDKTQPRLLVEIALTGADDALEEKSDAIFNALAENNLRGIFTLYYFSQTEFDSINDENENERLSPAYDNVMGYYDTHVE